MTSQIPQRSSHAAWLESLPGTRSDSYALDSPSLASTPSFHRRCSCWRHTGCPRCQIKQAFFNLHLSCCLNSETERPSPPSLLLWLWWLLVALWLSLSLASSALNHLLFLVVTKDSVLHCSCRTIPKTMPCSPVPFDSICMLNPNVYLQPGSFVKFQAHFPAAWLAHLLEYLTEMSKFLKLNTIFS